MIAWNKMDENDYCFSSVAQTFHFGKYKDLTLEDVLKINPSYVYWCVWNIQNFHITDEALYEISKLFPLFIISSDFMSKNRQFLRNEMYDDEEDDYYDDSDYGDEYYYQEEPTYSRYNGSYAQDEMGYSDDDIDTIFDGDPDAYWNID